MIPDRKHNRRAEGKVAEDFSELILIRNGYSILCRNYTAPHGEIDLIASKGKYICFIEVKMRSISSGLIPADAVDRKKLSRIKSATRFFLEEYRDNIYVSSLTPRIDIMEIYTSKGTVKKYNHITGIS
ncbi:MAG: YraN family protein [Clostridia bacterium]|nr:YraN family protein [Clostridia bacterium]MBQ8759258.1 YraN family protein [Clostridia bacterium]